MFEFKLQLGCLVIVLYIIFVYIKETYNKKLSCNKIFDSLLVVSPWAIVFDGLTAWLVNHLNIVPEWINILSHGIFYILMNITIIISYTYMVDIT